MNRLTSPDASVTTDLKQSWNLSPSELQSRQLDRLNGLLREVRDRPFYRDRLSGIQLPLDGLDQLRQVPLLNKSDLVPANAGEPGRIFDLAKTNYSRLHQTSGTSGFPLVVLDTANDWAWWLQCWDHVLKAAGITDQDVAMMAFSFGPFIGFWTANDALIRRGVMVVPGGGMTSEQRLQMIHDHRCSVVCCTPTYALHLASVAARNNIPLTNNDVNKIIVAGEPGGSIPVVRKRIEQAWGATVIDHSGASELGAWGFGSADGRGLHIIETEFVAELLRFDEANPEGVSVGDGQEAELVLTNLGRHGGPAIRYRTGDIVRGYRQHEHPCRFLWLDGGVIGRADDMVVVRGVNVFPSSIEAMIREIEPINEFRIIVSRRDEMDQLEIEIEADPSRANQLSELLRDRLAMRVPVSSVPPQSLPTFQAKARRMIDRRSGENAQ
jgi:phenylacetate-CoA ligase